MKLHFLLIISTILLSNFIPATSQEVEDEKDFSYVCGSENGPDRWGEIHQEWAICAIGKMQSPIDLRDESAKMDNSLGWLGTNYHRANAVIKNRGHDIMIRWEECAGGLWLNGKEYQLKQLHWHSPSEHLVNGQRYDLEAHMVHQSADDGIAVIGIMYTIGHPDRLLTRMEHYITNLDGNEEKKVGKVDPNMVYWFWGREIYYRYNGSLTTPPCTQGVTWTILKEVNTVSLEQVEMLKEAVNDGFGKNARPIQATNCREISLYLPHDVQFY